MIFFNIFKFHNYTPMTIKLRLMLLLQFVVSIAYSESFRFNSLERSVSIPEYTKEHSFKSNKHITIHIPVTLPYNKISADFGIEKVQLSITHPYISDIKVVLKSPDGTEVWLTNRNGKDGKDYMETIFKQNGFNGPISQGKPPFLGEYQPEGFLAHINNGQNPNGDWVLEVFDLQQQNEGIFNSVSLFFSDNPAKDISPTCSQYNLKNCIRTSSKDKFLLLPDLTIIPKYTENNITVIPPTHNKSGKVNFGVAIVNIGYGPLEIVASNEWYLNNVLISEKNRMKYKGNPQLKRLMYQNIFKLYQNELTKVKLKSTYVYFDDRPGHEHYHADNFVSYKLAKVNPEISDHTKWHVIGEGVKASFCIWNLGYCQDELDNCYDSNGNKYLVNNITNYGLGGKYRACDDAFQGLSVGGIDSYGQDYEGQSIEIPINTEKGEYALIIEVDTNNEYKEMTKANNLYIHKFFIN